MRNECEFYSRDRRILGKNGDKTKQKQKMHKERKAVEIMWHDDIRKKKKKKKQHESNCEQ